MSETVEPWKFHREIEGAVPDPPERIGYAELQKKVDVGQRGRVKRAVSTLVGLDVLQWSGQRNGRAVSQGFRSLDQAIEAGLIPMPDREIQTYSLLTAPLDAFIAQWHGKRQDPIDANSETLTSDDGVTVYSTSATRVKRQGEPATHTRPDLTVIVDLHFESLGDWNEVHAVEVKPYWAVDRSALFEAAAQAALGRCTFSWLLVWIPDESSGHFTGPQIQLIQSACNALEALKKEATDLGLGLLVANDLLEHGELKELAQPRRQSMEPIAANELFKSLGRTDGNRQ
jgi:hypothetical protein